MFEFLKEKFNKVLVIVVGILLLLIVILSIAVRYSHPRVESVDYSEQLLRIKFNRPMDKESVINALSIESADQFRAEWVDSELYLYFTKPLPAGTEQKVRFEGEVLDKYKRSLQDGLEFSFTTGDVKLYFVEKGNCGGFACDKLISSNQRLEKVDELYSGVLLKQFDIREELVAIVEKVNDRESVMLIDTASGDKERVYDFDKEVMTVKFHPFLNKLYFVVRDIKRDGELVLPDGSWRVDIFDFDRKIYQKFSLRNTILDVTDFQLSSDGNLALIQDGGSQNYFLFDLNDENNTIPLGQYISSSGFLPSGESIGFVKVDSLDFNAHPAIVLYSNSDSFESSDTALLTSREIYAVDPYLDDTLGRMAFSKRVAVTDSGRALFSVTVSDISGENSVEIPALQAKESLELPEISQDGRFLVMIAYDEAALLDYFNFTNVKGLPRPEIGKLIVYDLLEQKVVKELAGVGSFDLN